MTFKTVSFGSENDQTSNIVWEIAPVLHHVEHSESIQVKATQQFPSCEYNTLDNALHSNMCSEGLLHGHIHVYPSSRLESAHFKNAQHERCTMHDAFHIVESTNFEN